MTLYYKTNFFHPKKMFDFPNEVLYDELCDSIYQANYQNFDLQIQQIDILNCVISIYKMEDIVENIEKLNIYLLKSNQILCPQLFSNEFLSKLVDLMNNKMFSEIWETLIVIIRSLWKAGDPETSYIYFNDEFIHMTLQFFENLEPFSKCLYFDAVIQLLKKCPEKTPLILQYGIVEQVQMLLNQYDVRNLKDRLYLPLFLINVITKIIGEDFPSLPSLIPIFMEICISFISSQFGVPREIVTETLYDLLKIPDAIQILFKIPQSIQTIIKAHYLNYIPQFRYLYKIDTIIWDYGGNEAYFHETSENNSFMINLAKYVLRDQKYTGVLKYVLEFLINEMSKIKDCLLSITCFMKLINIKDYLCLNADISDFQKYYKNFKPPYFTEAPLIYKILEISTSQNTDLRFLAAECISHFLLEEHENMQMVLEIARNGGFASICTIVPNLNSHKQIFMLKSLILVLDVDTSFIEYAESNDLLNDILNISSYDDTVTHLIQIIQNIVNSTKC